MRVNIFSMQICTSLSKKAHNTMQKWTKDMCRQFKEREIQITYKYMKNSQLHSKLKKCKLKLLDMILTSNL